MALQTFEREGGMDGGINHQSHHRESGKDSTLSVNPEKPVTNLAWQIMTSVAVAGSAELVLDDKTRTIIQNMPPVAQTVEELFE